MDATTPETKLVTKHKQRLQTAIENAQKLLEQRKAALQAIEARERAKADRTPAKTINRQKYLLGAYMMEKRPQLAKSLEFQEWLKRPQDRTAFGLEPIPKGE